MNYYGLYVGVYVSTLELFKSHNHKQGCALIFIRILKVNFIANFIERVNLNRRLDFLDWDNNWRWLGMSESKMSDLIKIVSFIHL
ncbi:hypothetical protein BpHYR1_002873 [Brachionus plicatilis]|uniref:Uncharacterized protein n=1 Tax=Brachionus plicatilis TaxID=10195 RepID=A0A3M7QJS8_BRAPC|nr:hypothetical protein BpHYR1_002873 [Brachionus plicatilis]